MKKKSMIKYAILCMVALCFAMQVQAGSTSDKIKEAEEEKNQTENQLEHKKSEISELETTKKNLEGALDSLNNQLIAINDELNEINKNIVVKSEEIAENEEKYEIAKGQEKKQYADMKKRIQFMYERGDKALMEIFLESKSFSEMLNRTEYYTRVTEYDRNMLVKYQKAKADLVLMERELEQEYAELVAMYAQAEEKQAQIGTLVAKTSSEITKYQGDIQSAEQKALLYEEELNQKKSEISSLKKQEEEEKAEAARRAAEEAKNAEAAKKAEEARKSAQQKAASSGSSAGIDSSSNAASAGDLALLAAIIQCEAGGESYEGKLAVGSVVMNRVRSGAYPGTVLGVIYQSGQFSPVASGRFAMVLAQGAGGECTSAAQAALSGTDNVGGLLHFKRNDGSGGLVIGNHMFY